MVFSSNQWFNASFKFLICLTYSVLSCRLAPRFWLFQFLSFQAKRVNQCEDYVTFRDSEHQVNKIPFITFIVIVFYKVFMKFRNIVTHLKPFTSTFCDMSIQINYLHSNMEDMVILCFHLNLSCICHQLVRIDERPFCTINNMQISLKRSKFTLFFKVACYANPGAGRKRAESTSYL